MESGEYKHFPFSSIICIVMTESYSQPTHDAAVIIAVQHAPRFVSINSIFSGSRQRKPRSESCQRVYVTYICMEYGVGKGKMKKLNDIIFT